MLVASLLWYRNIKSDLEEEGFVFNPYNACITNRTHLGKQQTISLQVNGMLVSSESKQANDDFHQWCKAKYGGLKRLSATARRFMNFLE